MTAAFEGGAEGGAPVRTEPPLAVGDLAETAAVARESGRVARVRPSAYGAGECRVRVCRANPALTE